MRTLRNHGRHAALVSVIGLCLALPYAISAEVAGQQTDEVALGKEIAFDRVKGNCLACHMIDDGELPGNIAPPLIAMKQRFPDPAVLRAQIWDATERNSESVMPPYGRHKILSEDEIDLIVTYLYTL